MKAHFKIGDCPSCFGTGTVIDFYVVNSPTRNCGRCKAWAGYACHWSLMNMAYIRRRARR